MQLRDRWIVVQPDTPDATLAQAAQDAGAWALVDATRPGWQAHLDALENEKRVLRAPIDADPVRDVDLVVLAPWRVEPAHVDALGDAIDAWQAHGVPVAVEAKTQAEGRRARDAGADALVARGGEGPGRASDRSNLVLLPALAELDLPLIAWGGAGPNASAALFVHADMVVLDAQFYLLDEAGLDDAWTRALDAFDGTDVKALGSTLDEPYYVHARVADEHVHDLWEAEQAAHEEGPGTRRARVRAAVQNEHAGWTRPPGTGLTPLGHDAAHASFFARFDDLASALTWLEARIEDQFDGFPLTEDSPLANAHGTRYPIVQGAMANVSEVPAFAKAVSDAGALPFLAFAALREQWAREALEGTIDALDTGQSFGCGIIGLDVNARKRDAHVRLLKEHKPPYALIAAGTAEQALDLEQAGIDTYMHTPSPGIVRQATEMGLTHIVVEGNECGGHIGKLPSLVLWDQTLQEAGAQDDLHVLLAGGIGDEDTAAMAGVLAGAASARVGALMGTAYLATEEIVETGAIPDTYQDLVIASRETEVTGETVGIRARSAPTPFTENLTDLERRLVREGTPLDERKETFEHENLGATRVAARGVKRDEDGTYHEIPTDEQLHDGNFLMGQGAERIEQRYTLDELHQRVTRDAHERTRQARKELARGLDLWGAPPEQRDPGRAVAIVGLGCVFPDAPNVDAYWRNLLEGRVSIRELPEDRWPVDPRIHHRPGEQDGTDTLLGAFVEDDAFDPIEYRIPPTVAEQMDPCQTWAISATDEAIQDAGLSDVEDRDRWAVILGNAQGGEHRNWADRRLTLREAVSFVEDADVPEDAKQAAVAALEERIESFHPITEDTMPGELSNIIAGRVCNTFDIGGPARTVDTACASTLAATEEAVRQLRDGVVDVAITGGVDRSMHPAAFTKFSAIGALSTEGSFPFSERASGFVMGEGCGILVCKRLEDALADGDTVYAVIEGVGSSSDGAGKGITAPNPEGQARAIRRALDDADLDPATLDFVEAHGTGTPVGDPTEAQTLEQILADAEPGSIALGSVKANIGHLKSAAGAAGLIKAALAIHERTLPPTPVEDPTPEVDWSTSPLALAQQATPLPNEGVRAGVSAFGFGGTNSHVTLASPPTPDAAQPTPVAEPAGRKGPHPLEGVRHVSGPDAQTVIARLDDDPHAAPFNPEDPVRVAIAPGADLDTARKALSGELPPELALNKGVAVATGEPGGLGLVFPGQGSQYPGMALELAGTYPAAREVLERADQVLTPLIGRPLTKVLSLDGDEGLRALTPTEVCQPAVLACDVAILRVLEELGVEPDVVAGHSLGEYAALVAADVLTLEDALHAVSARGREMADVEVDDPGGLVALRAGPDTAQDLIDGLDAWPANINGPAQTVVAGTTQALETIQARADERDVKASQLPVSAAFHSPIVAPATGPLRNVLDRRPVDSPSVPVIANTTGEPYPEDPDAIRGILAEQVASPVRWVDTMQAFQAAGADTILEVGPKTVLTNLASSNLPEATALPTAHPRKGETETFETACLMLAANGHLETPGRARAKPAPDRAGTPTPALHAASTAKAPQNATRSTPRQGPDRAARTNGHREAPQARDRRVVVSGVSLGVPVPGGEGDPFAPEAKQALLAGGNRIGAVPDAERERMASLGVTRLVKDGPNGPSFEPVTDPDDVVQLSGRLGDIDLTAYDVHEDWLDGADPTARAGVAAALEALSDARIPLVRDTRETSTGTTLEEGWVLPESIQGETGVILASAFPGHASLVEILENHPAAGPAQPVPSGDGSDRVVDFLTDLVPTLDDRETRKRALELLTEHATGPVGDARPPASPIPGGAGPARANDGEFPRDFLFRTLAMGHAQIAQLINARGPNIQVNAACASTTSALALAQDWIEQGRCERVIVVGADVAGDEPLLPWIGGGFMAAGAATTRGDIEEAAVPFDQRRNGMLVGSGAVGLVVETATAAQERGLTPIAELAATHVANSAYHGARLDPDHVADQVDALLENARDTLDLDASQLAEDLVFVSHEPATPARGGSAQAEVQALRRALGDAAGDVLITNTKGLTGHAMGAGIEDGIAVELLRARQAPPVANLEQPDPEFQDLTFSRGGATDRSLSLRFAAGFGSQVALALFHRTSQTPGALDRDTFDAWVRENAGQASIAREAHRLLRAVQDRTTTRSRATASGNAREEPATPEAAPTASATGNASARTTAATTSTSPDKAAGQARQPDASDAREQDQDPARQPADAGEVQQVLLGLVSRKTGYPEDVIEPGMDLEADLGVDTVKQAEVLSQARNELGIPPIEGLSLSDVPTLEDAARLLAEHAGGEPSNADTQPAPTGGDSGNQPATGTTSPTQADPQPATEPETNPPDPATGDTAKTTGRDEPSDPGGTDAGEVQQVLLGLVSRKTGYPEDVIEPGMDLEADLGVDTVKQAEVLSQARNELGIPPIEGLSLSDVPTLEDAARLLAEHAPDANPTTQAAGATGASNPGADPAPDTGDGAGTDANVDPDPSEGIRTLAWREQPAPPAPRLAASPRVHVAGDHPDALGQAIQAHGAQLVDENPDVLVHPLAPLADGLESVVADLAKLQDTLDQATRLVLVANAGHDLATGLAPLAATLAQEGYPARAVLVDGDVPPERLARELLADTDASVQVTPDARRRTALAPAPQPEPLDLPEGAVVLAPGGLGAAVAPCLEHLASTHDVRVATCGRTPLDDPGIDPDDEDEIQQLRSRLLQEAREEGKTVRPADVEARVQQIRKRARRVKAYERLDEHCTVRYDQVDATDPDELDAWIEAAREMWDAPALVVHGTGAERSRAFQDKTADEMQLVLTTKLAPVAHLTQRLPEAHHVAFGSIAGVTGNPGQADYALANGALTGLIDRVDGTVLHWTAWDAPGGMADDDTVRQVLDERDVAFLDPADGARRFTTWAATPGAFAVADLDPDPLAPIVTGQPLRLDLSGEEPWLADHAINGRPLLPAVWHLHAMREAAAQANGRRPHAVHAIRFKRPLRVTEPAKVHVETDGDALCTTREGTRYARAVPVEDAGAKRFTLPEDAEGTTLEQAHIYERLFHGPRFQVLEHANVRDDAVLARANLATGGAPSWALALEAGMQAAGLAGQTQTLPVGIEELHVGTEPTTGTAHVHARRVGDDLAGTTWDLAVYSDADEVIVLARGLRLQATTGLQRWTDAALQLSNGTNAQVRVTSVPPHDPRDPRAKQDAETRAGTQAAMNALESVHGTRVQIQRAENGQPQPVDAPGGVTITHGHGLAVAAANPDLDQIGIDLERVEPRADAWLEDHFTADERQAIRAHPLDDDTAATLVWTLKEAASKAIGHGLDRPADEIQVALDDESARVHVDEGTLEGRWTTVDQAVVSLVHAPPSKA